MSVRWLDRDEWGAGPLIAGYQVPHAQFVGLVSHHTVIAYNGDPIAYMQTVQHSRPDLGDEVPYSFVIMPGPTDQDAIVGEGRGWGRTGAHTAGYNSTRYGIAWAGDYTNVEPTPGMLSAFRWLGSQLADPYGAQPTLGHRDVKATACPGDCAYPHLPELQPPFRPLLEDDMPTPEEYAIAVWEHLIQTRRGEFPAQQVVGWTKDEISEDDNLLARIVAAIPAGGGASPDEIKDAVKQALREGSA